MENINPNLSNKSPSSHPSLIPPFIPDGIEQNIIIKEQDRIFKYIRHQRALQIIQTHASKYNLASNNNNISENIKILYNILVKGSFKDETLLNDLLEVKKMYVFEKQRSMKEKLISMLQLSVMSEQLINAATYCDLEYSPLKYAHMMEKFERTVYEKERNVLKLARNKYLSDVTDRWKFLVCGKREARDVWVKAIYKGVDGLHEEVIKEGALKRENEVKETLRVLKSNDESGYVSYLQKIKNKQIDLLRESINIKPQSELTELNEHQQNDELREPKLENLIQDNPCFTLNKFDDLYNQGTENFVMDAKINCWDIINRIYSKIVEGKLLFIVPKTSVLKWVEHISLNLPEIALIRIESYTEILTGKYKQIMQRETRAVVLISYDCFEKKCESILNFDWFYIIFDASHPLFILEPKNMTIYDSKFKCKKRICIIGDSYYNQINYLWGVMQFILHSIFPMHKNVNEFLREPIKFTDIDLELTSNEKILIDAEIKGSMSNILLTDKKTSIDNIDEVRCCSLTNIQITVQNELLKIYNMNISKKFYDRNRANSSQFYAYMHDNIINPHQCIIELQKNINHPILVPYLKEHIPESIDNKMLLLEASGKFIELCSILNEQSSKKKITSILFRNSYLVDMLEEILNMNNYKHTIMDLDETQVYNFVVAPSNSFAPINTNNVSLTIIFEKLIVPDKLNTSKTIHLVTKNSVEEFIFMIEKYYRNFDMEFMIDNNESLIATEFSKFFKNNIVKIDFKKGDTFTLQASNIDVDNTSLKSLDNINIFKITKQDEEIKRPKRDTNNVLDEKTVKNNLISKLFELKDRSRSRIDIFLELPDFEEYPDYYEIIVSPISIEIIQERVNNDQYGLNDMIDDLCLMFDNAILYNVEESVVYKDAIYMKNYVTRHYRG